MKKSDIKNVFVLFFSLPLLIGILWYSLTWQSHSLNENMQQGTQLIIDASTPWWTDFFRWITDLPTAIGAAILMFVSWLMKKGYIPEQ